MPPPYTHFRMIAYEVPTVASSPNGGSILSGWDPGLAAPAVARLPVPAGLPADADIRLHRLAGVVDFAWNELQLAGDNASTLKVFIVPEFYFRPPAATGAGYDNNTYPRDVAMQIIGALDTMFSHADFADWLLVCGTVMWNSRDDLVAAPLYYNTAVYVNGGRNQGARFIEKKLASNLDGVPQAMVPGADPQAALVMEDWANRRLRAFTRDGVQFGIEVCLDHLDSDGFRVLKQVLADWPDDNARPSVQLHLLPAGGMKIKPGCVVARPGGYILRNDGITNPAPYSEMRRVDGYAWWGIETNPWNMWGSAAMTPIALASASAVPAGALRVPDAPGGRLTFAQRVVFYPPTNLPA